MKVTFITDSGGEQKLTAQHVEDRVSNEYYGTEYDEAVNGHLRTRLKGVREIFEVTYEASKQAGAVRELFNNIRADIESGFRFFYFGIDEDDLKKITLDESFYRTNYLNQIGIFFPTIKMRSIEHITIAGLTIGDWRFIYEAVIERRDYGLITQAVTQQIDYGSI